MRPSSFLTSLVCAVAVCAATAAEKPSDLLAEIDDLCKCTGMERKTGVLSRKGDRITLRMSADGITKTYWFDLVDGRYPATFGPEGYKVHYELPLVKNAAQKVFCVGVVKRLDTCKASWDHYGKPEVAVDPPWGFRVSYWSQPEKKRPVFSTCGHVFFLMTKKGTVCSVWYGER
jgi:hypothetical protein